MVQITVAQPQNRKSASSVYKKSTDYPPIGRVWKKCTNFALGIFYTPTTNVMAFLLDE
jgi:hypothetical protein